MQVQSLGQEDALEEGTATHSGILVWRIPWTEAWRATVHRDASSWTRLKRLSIHIFSQTSVSGAGTESQLRIYS